MYDELYHHGIKGMHWGVRRYQNPDGSLTPAGIKKYARKQFADEAYSANKTLGGKVWDTLTDAHKHTGRIKYDSSPNHVRKLAAEKYLQKQKDPEYIKKKRKQNIEKGAILVSGVLAFYAVNSARYKKETGGRSMLKDIKAGATHAGRAAISLTLRAMGHEQVTWIDNDKAKSRMI